MAIDSDYTITVNGYPCRSCSDVAFAARHIDPAEAASGPHGLNRETPEQRAMKNHFAPEARRTDMLEDLHRALRVNAVNPYAAAYGAAGANAAPGQFVDRTA